MFGIPLYDLDPDHLRLAASDRRWPKWSTMCLLRSLGLPVLNAVCVPPTAGRAALRDAVDTLSRSTGTARLMVRSDGGVERRSYYRGGNSFVLPEAESVAADLLDLGRAVVLLEPTNRFSNQLTALLRLDRDDRGPGTLTIEALGPGYDVADLTRGGLSPQVRVTVTGVDWRNFERPWLHDIRVVRDTDPSAADDRVRRRLDLVAHHLRAVGQLGLTGRRDDAERWLRAAGHTELFDGGDPTADVVGNLRHWFEDAFALGSSHLHRSWRCLALPYSEMARRRPVYWDVIDGAVKYAMPR